jgi:hypothetical protein
MVALAISTVCPQSGGAPTEKNLFPQDRTQITE